MIKRPLPKSIRERKNIIKVGDNAAMLANENNNWTFWLLKVHALTLNTITCHWYDLHDGKFFLQYIDGDSKKPSLSVYNHNEITLIHWGFELTQYKKLKIVDQRAIEMSPSLNSSSRMDDSGREGIINRKRKVTETKHNSPKKKILIRFPHLLQTLQTFQTLQTLRTILIPSHSYDDDGGSNPQ